MSSLTPEAVKQFLTAKYSEQLKSAGQDPANVPDTFDFLLGGIVDSFGMLDMVSAMEEHFAAQIDLSDLEPEKMTVLGPLAQYVAARAVLKTS